MEIIKNFGIDPYLLAAQIINFLVLFYLLKRFAFKPILQVLEKRKREIQEGIERAEEGKMALEKALEEEKKILKKAQSEAQKILSNAQNQAEKTTDEMKDRAKGQVEQMLHDAQLKRDREERELEKRIAISAAKLAVDMVNASIEGVFSKKEQEEAVEKLAKKLKVA